MKFLPRGAIPFSSRLVFPAEAIDALGLQDNLNSNCYPDVLMNNLTVVGSRINTDEFSQGKIGIVGDLCNDNSSLLLYIAPEIDSIAIPNLFSETLFNLENFSFEKCI